MSLAKEVEKLKYDKRLLEWNVSRGKLTPAEKKAYLDSLPDLASNVENLGISSSDDDYEDEIDDSSADA